MGREMANMTNKTDVLVHHGSTDAPTVDVYETGVGAGMILDNLAYTAFAGYLELQTANYGLQIRDETGETVVATYAAPLDELNLDGAAITVVASGFLNPANNSNGAPFGLWVALASGGSLVELTNTSGIEDVIDLKSLAIYPNPAKTTLNLNFSVKQDENVNLEILNILGTKVLELNAGNLQKNAFHRESLNVSNLPDGIYIVNIRAGDSQISRKIQIIK
jgi:hypothetical protein